MRYGNLHPNYSIVEAIIIRDEGGDCPSVTNDVVYVVDELRDAGRLGKKTRLFYLDSQGELDEIVLGPDRRFLRFAPGPGRATPPAVFTSIPPRPFGKPE